MNRIREKIYQLPQKEKFLLDSLIVEKEYKKGELIFDSSSSDHYSYYVVDGLLRKYVSKNGLEKTLDFYFSDDVYFSPIQHQDNRTNCYLQALRKTVLYKISNLQFEKVKFDKPDLLHLENIILEAALAQTSGRLQDFQTMTAKERYQALLERNPRVIQKLPLIYVASYLGINNA
ncbi:MAG: cyclic nucleotide-binding domain-containing protein, partial [Bacteroidota bacterium]